MADNGTYYAILVEGVVNIPRAGSWTFSVGSDDGFSLEAWNEKYHFQSEYTGARGYGQTPAIFRVQEPGAYNVRLLYFQATGGAALDFCVKEGEFEDYENFTLDGFSLVGTAASGVTHAGHEEHDGRLRPRIPEGAVQRAARLQDSGVRPDALVRGRSHGGDLLHA